MPRDLPNKSRFDPFNSRACRDLRNGLSESLVAAIQQGVPDPIDAIARTYADRAAQAPQKAYLVKRLKRYGLVFERIQTIPIPIEDTYRIAVLLWDQELFFEVHEWLEAAWHRAHGPAKAVLQGLIRAAGTYVHLELGRRSNAAKIAAKAIAQLEAHQADVPPIIEIQLLLTKLKSLDPLPPKIGTIH
jgi:hypothetical protein